jgi:hypothetical protein
MNGLRMQRGKSRFNQYDRLQGGQRFRRGDVAVQFGFLGGSALSGINKTAGISVTNTGCHVRILLFI